jgi:hypothetical protein
VVRLILSNSKLLNRRHSLPRSGSAAVVLAAPFFSARNVLAANAAPCFCGEEHEFVVGFLETSATNLVTHQRVANTIESILTVP